MDNAMRCPPLAHRSAAAHKLHSARSNRYKIRESQNQNPGTGLSLFQPGDCPNERDHRRFNSFKNERVHGIRYTTHAEMQAASFEFIEVLYNRKRQHSTLGYKSPVQFLANWISRQNQEKLVA